MFYGWNQIAMVYVIFIIAAWQLYPGASMELSTVIAIIGGLALAGIYGLFSSVYPRSGGEYVFLSRTLLPVIGFVVSFSFAFWQLFYFGLNAAFFGSVGLSPLFGSIGVLTGNQAALNIGTWFVSAWGQFVAGLIVIGFFTYVMYRGMRWYFRVQRWAAYVTAGSLLLTLIVLVLAWAGVFNFKANFDAFAGAGAYAKVISQGAATGVALHPAFSLGQTINFLLWPAFSLWFAVASTSFSGEVKNVRRGQVLGITGAILSMGAVMIALMYLSRHVFGSDFVLASSALPASKFPLAVAPSILPMTAIAVNNVVIAVLINLWAIAIAFLIASTTLVYATRAMLAWGIDGMGPEALANVSEKYHSPTVAIVIGGLIGLFALTIYSFTTLAATLAGFLGFAPAFAVMSLNAIVFPYLRKDLFERSPIAFRVGGIPLISILGVIGSAFSIFVFYRLFVDGAYGANKPFTLWLTAGVLLTAIVWFYAARSYRASKGVDMARRYAEIPIE